MKLIHLSDLHIGKRVNEFSMIEDQKYILEQILEIIRKEHPNAVFLAGDIYDKSQPSAEAVQVLDTFLTALFRENIAVFVISGNHDSAERVAFGSQLFRACRLYVSPAYNGKIEPISMEDSYGKIKIWMLPFIKPAIVKHALKLEERESLSYHDAARLAIENMKVDSSERNLLLAHQFVTGASRSDSEEIMVGGIDEVHAEVFDVFDYVALGHIHRPQKVYRETLRYCGTPLKYSFSEAAGEKSVTVVEIGKKEDVKVRTIPLIPLHDMRKIRGTYLEVTAKEFYKDSDVYDYLHVTLTDEEDVPHALEKLRSIYPNLMQLEYDNKRTRGNQNFAMTDGERQKSELQLFEEFYEMQNNQSLKEEQREYLEEMIAHVKEEEV